MRLGILINGASIGLATVWSNAVNRCVRTSFCITALVPLGLISRSPIFSGVVSLNCMFHWKNASPSGFNRKSSTFFITVLTLKPALDISILRPAAVRPVPVTPVWPCMIEGMPVCSSANCLALSNICMFSPAVLGNFIPLIAVPVTPDCRLNIFPGYMSIVWPGTSCVSSMSNTRLPANARLSIAIRMWPFISIWLSSMFSATPTPNSWYGLSSYGKAW